MSHEDATLGEAQGAYEICLRMSEGCRVKEKLDVSSPALRAGVKAMGINNKAADLISKSEKTFIQTVMTGQHWSIYHNPSLPCQ